MTLGTPVKPNARRSTKRRRQRPKITFPELDTSKGDDELKRSELQLLRYLLKMILLGAIFWCPLITLTCLPTVREVINQFLQIKAERVFGAYAL